jgi:hypothetical protein
VPRILSHSLRAAAMLLYKGGLRWHACVEGLSSVVCPLPSALRRQMACNQSGSLAVFYGNANASEEKFGAAELRN